MRMRVETVLKRLVAAELCTMFEDWTQVDVSCALDTSQGDVSLIRRGKLAGFSVSRLLRYFVWRRYNLEVRLLESAGRHSVEAWPTVTLVRVDRFGHEVGRRQESAR